MRFIVILVVILFLAFMLFLALGTQVLVAREILQFLKLQAAINREQMAINAELRRLVEGLAAERCE